MKKLLLWSLPLALLLTGCNSSSAKDVERKDLNKDVISQNAKEYKISDKTDITKIKTVSSFNYDKEEFASTSYFNLGLAVTKNAQGYIGFKNILSGRAITRNTFEERWVTYEAQRDTYIGFILTIHYNGQKIIFDSNGFKLYEGTDEVSFESSYIDDCVYLTKHIVGKPNEYYMYTGNALAHISDLPIPTPTPAPDPEEDEPIDEFNFMSRYTDIARLRLDKFGHAGYYMSSKDGLFTTFSGADNPVCTFSIPTSNDIVAGISGDYVYYQSIVETSDEAEEYSYIQNSKKYVLNSYKIDYMSGKKESMDLDYVFESLLQYKDKDGIYSYSLATIRPIEKGRVLGASKTTLMDKKLNFIQDVSNEHIDSFYKLSNGNYYNISTKILYNAELKPVVYLSALNPTVDAENGLFWGEKDGLIGAVNFSGRVVIPFEVTNKVSNIVDDKILLTIDKQVYRFDLKTGDRRIVGSSVQQVTGHIFVTQSQDGYVYLDETQTLVTLKSKLTGIGSMITYYNKGYAAFGYFNNDTRYTFEKFVADQLYVYSNNPYGTEKTEPVHYGETESDAITLKFNEEFITKYSNYSGTYSAYYRFNNDSQSYGTGFNITVPYDAQISSVRCYDSTGSYSSISPTYNTDGDKRIYTISLPYTFYVTFRYVCYSSGTIKVTDIPTGTQENPLLLNNGESKEIKLSNNFYVALPNTSKTGIYKIDLSSLNVNAYDVVFGDLINGAWFAYGSDVLVKLSPLSPSITVTVKITYVSSFENYAYREALNVTDYNDYFNLTTYQPIYFRNTTNSVVTRYLTMYMNDYSTFFYGVENDVTEGEAESVVSLEVSIEPGKVFIAGAFTDDNKLAIKLSNVSEAKDLKLTNVNYFEVESDDVFYTTRISGYCRLFFEVQNECKVDFNFSGYMYSYNYIEVKINDATNTKISSVSGNLSRTVTLSELYVGDIIEIEYYSNSTSSSYYLEAFYQTY